MINEKEFALLFNTLKLLNDSVVGQSGGSEMLTGFVLPMVLIFGIFYFLVIMPQKKQQKKHQEMLSTLRKGDMVTTTSGMRGKIVEVRDTTMKIEIAPKVTVVFERNVITGMVAEQSEEGKD
ncbi:preprotein translocase subunit YajC [bacterium]|nr:preprotein translocase subunit YajC [bacterium]